MRPSISVNCAQEALSYIPTYLQAKRRLTCFLNMVSIRILDAIGDGKHFSPVIIKHFVCYLVREWTWQDIAARINSFEINGEPLRDSHPPFADSQVLVSRIISWTVTAYPRTAA